MAMFVLEFIDKETVYTKIFIGYVASQLSEFWMESIFQSNTFKLQTKDNVLFLCFFILL